MDRINGFVQVWHTSSCSTDDTSGVIEGHVKTSSDVTFTLDFPLVRETYINTPGAIQNSSIKRRDNKGSEVSTTPFHTYSQFTAIPSASDMTSTRPGLENPSWLRAKLVDACNQFSDITTFHGMRFVCTKHIHRIRRIVWMILVVVCLFALALQVYQQVQYFNSNPKSVSVESKHSDYVEFPSVTICNENTFKITAASDNGLYGVINKMMTGALTTEDLKKAGVENLKLDELNYLLGNHKETMLLRCKWAGEDCGIDNFTTIITDHGLCFTFNGPDVSRKLIVNSAGIAKGLQLTINVEEYERMAGPHVASGLHMLVHMKRQYPVVESLGQAVAAGSHSFVALDLRKENRLGQPYDRCKDGVLNYIPNQTYDYDLPACHIECSIDFAMRRCGCLDYYMFGDAEFCTMTEYLTCLRSIQYDDTVKAEKQCDCTVPCRSELAVPSYSYAALSKSAIDEVDAEDIQKIIPRYKKALDAYEYLSLENQYKKDIYRTYSRTLEDVSVLYGDTMVSLLLSLKEKIQQLQQFVLGLHRIKDDFLWAQEYVVKKNFIEAKNEMDERTLGELADDIHVFSDSIQNKIGQIATVTDKPVRDVLYILLAEQLEGRLHLTTLGLQDFSNMVAAYENGSPILNYSLPADRNISELFDEKSIIPKSLLKQALTQSEDGSKIGLAGERHIKTICNLLRELLNVSQRVYESENITEEQQFYIGDCITKFKDACELYLKSRENFYDEIIEWPVSQLQQTRESLEDRKDKCLDQFGEAIETIDKLLSATRDTVNKSLQTFARIDAMLHAYMDDWSVTKFDLASALLCNESIIAKSDLAESRQTIILNFKSFGSLWSKLSRCIAEMLEQIFSDEVLWNIFESGLKGKQNISLANVTETQAQVNNTIQDDPRLKNLENFDGQHLHLVQLLDEIVEDMEAFTESAVIDSSFYSQNFIFLDVFFTDISYTVTEHQVAYDVFKLLSDIGGSMGLLVGASAISLFEFVDFFCIIATYLCKSSRKYGLRHNNGAISSSEGQANNR